MGTARYSDKWPGEEDVERMLDISYMIHRAKQLGIPPQEMEGWPNGKAPARNAGEPREGQAGSTPAPSANELSKLREELEATRMQLQQAQDELTRMRNALAQGKLHQPHCTSVGVVGDGDCRCAAGLKIRNLRRIAKSAGTERLPQDEQSEPTLPATPPTTEKDERMDHKVAELMRRAVVGGMEEFESLLMEAWQDGYAAANGVDVRDYILKLVEQHGSGAKVGLMCGLDRSYISLFINGKREPSPETAAKLGLRKEARYFPK